MNGELYQLSRLVLYVKESMRTGSKKEFRPGKYADRLLFSFIPGKNVLQKFADECGDALSWYESLKKRQIKDIRLIIFFEKNDIRLAGFVNAASQGMVTEYSDGKTTIWAARWEFDKNKKAWIRNQQNQWVQGITYIKTEEGWKIAKKIYRKTGENTWTESIN